MALEGEAIAITALTSTSTAVTSKVIWSRRRSIEATEGASPRPSPAPLASWLTSSGLGSRSPAGGTLPAPMRVLTIRSGIGTRAARIEGDEAVELPYQDVGALLASGDDWGKGAGPHHALH